VCCQQTDSFLDSWVRYVFIEFTKRERREANYADLYRIKEKKNKTIIDIYIYI